MAEKRLGQLEMALGDRMWLVGEDFTVADLMMASVLKVARGLELLDKHPTLSAYQGRCLDRPAYRKAVSEQCATIAQHQMADMQFDHVE
jgi:glutathione S-transferase